MAMAQLAQPCWTSSDWGGQGSERWQALPLQVGCVGTAGHGPTLAVKGGTATHLQQGAMAMA